MRAILILISIVLLAGGLKTVAQSSSDGTDEKTSPHPSDVEWLEEIGYEYPEYIATVGATDFYLVETKWFILAGVRDGGPKTSLIDLEEYHPGQYVYENELRSAIIEAYRNTPSASRYGTPDFLDLLVRGHDYAEADAHWSDDISRDVLRVPSTGGRRFPESSLAPTSIQELRKQNAREAEQAALFETFQKDEPSPEEQERLIDAARQSNAEDQGRVRLAPDYWDDYIAFYETAQRERVGDRFTITARRLLDGDFSRRRAVNFVDPLFRYVENMNDTCPTKARAEGAPITITTTRNTYNKYTGDVTASREVGDRTVYVDVDLLPFYRQHFDKYQRRLDELGSSVVIGAITDLYNGNSGSSFSSRMSAAAAGPSWSTNYVFGKEGCESPVLRQLKENIVRAAGDRPSLQADGLNYRGERSGSAPGGAPELLFSTFDNIRVQLRQVYAGAPQGWLPEKPAELLNKAAKTLGERYPAPSGSQLIRIGPAIEIVDAKADSLKAMRVTSIFVADADPVLQDDFLYNAKAGAYHAYRGVRVRSSDSMIVVCEYANGSAYTFWFEKTPELINDPEYRSRHSDSGLLRVNPPRGHCPSSYDGPSKL